MRALRKGKDPPTTPEVRPLPTTGTAPPYLLLAAFSAGAAAIHASVIQPHFLDGAIYGIFFTIACGLQLLWALVVTTRPSQAVLRAGAWGNLAIALLWVASRTTGLPGGSHPWEAEPVTSLDATTTALEIGIFLVVMLRIRTPTRRDVFGISAAVIAIATSASVIALSEPHLHLSSTQIDPDRVRQAALAGTTDGEIITAPLYGGYVEAFVEEIVAGPNGVHVGFFSRNGRDRAVTDLVLVSRSPEGLERELSPRPLAPSHYVARARLTPGVWTFAVSATTEDGGRLVAEFEQPIERR